MTDGMLIWMRMNMTGIFETAGDIVEKIDTVVDSIPETISVFAIDNFNLIMLIFSSIVFGSAFIFLFRLTKEIVPSDCDDEY